MYPCGRVCFCLLLYFWHMVQLYLNFKNSRAQFHMQQKIHGVFASAQETDDVPTACGE